MKARAPTRTIQSERGPPFAALHGLDTCVSLSQPHRMSSASHGFTAQASPPQPALHAIRIVEEDPSVRRNPNLRCTLATSDGLAAHAL